MSENDKVGLNKKTSYFKILKNVVYKTLKTQKKHQAIGFNELSHLGLAIPSVFGEV